MDTVRLLGMMWASVAPPQAMATERVEQSPRAGRFDPFGRLVAAIDRMRLGQLGIHEYCDDERCIFRLSKVAAWRTTHLSDGTVLHPGELVGKLHLANERMPYLAVPQGGLAWGKRLAANYVHSLRLLAARVAEDGEFAALGAFGNDFTLPYGKGTLRVIRRVGFEVLEPIPRRGIGGRLVQLGTRLWTALLRRVHNPMSLAGLRLRDLETRPVWITRRTLLERYRPPAEASPPPGASLGSG